MKKIMTIAAIYGALIDSLFSSLISLNHSKFSMRSLAGR